MPRCGHSRAPAAASSGEWTNVPKTYWVNTSDLAVWIAEKGYSGSLSVELFLPEFQQADPYEVARWIREKAEGVMRQARVI